MALCIVIASLSLVNEFALAFIDRVMSSDEAIYFQLHLTCVVYNTRSA